jgi:energy-converting hydrogenase Eha subunit G
MHVSVGGIEEVFDFSTDEWQNRQSIPSSVAWCLWLKGTGWLIATSTLVFQGPREIVEPA